MMSLMPVAVSVTKLKYSIVLGAASIMGSPPSVSAPGDTMRSIQ